MHAPTKRLNERVEELAKPTNGFPTASCAIAAALGLGAGWLAANSTGLLGHPLRHSLTAMAMLCVVFVGWPRRSRPVAQYALLLAALAVSLAILIAMGYSTLFPVNVLGVALVLAVMAWQHEGNDRKVLRISAEAIVLLGIFRFAVTSVPIFWMMVNSVGALIGDLTGRLSLGATFAGVDYLVVMLFVVVRSAVAFRPLGPGDQEGSDVQRQKFYGAVVAALFAVAIGHAVYLAVLETADDLITAMPKDEKKEVPVGDPPLPNIYERWITILIPWNVPAVAAIIHIALASLILYFLPRRCGRTDPVSRDILEVPRSGPRLAATSVAVVLALALPMISTLFLQSSNVEKKTIVVYEKGYLNWMRPKHDDYGRLSIGMYGMMQTYIESLGGTCIISPDLSQDDLEKADALILIYPDDPWEEGQLDRIEAFVRDGGSLLVLGEHTVRAEKHKPGVERPVYQAEKPDELGDARFNEVLAKMTSMRVRFDSSTFAVGGWLQSYEALAHPTNVGITDTENDFGAVIGASLDIAWPAQPLLIGRWGWNDPGDENAWPSMMGNHRYDDGEKLGDVILAAEQPLGRGKVIAVGDTSAMTNGLTIGCHQYTSRLLAYLADGPQSGQPLYRQILTLLGCVVLVAAICYLGDDLRVVLVSLFMGAVLVVCQMRSVEAVTYAILPEGGQERKTNNLAYIDASHSEAFSRESWRVDGVMGLCLTLMRNGYLTMMLPEFTAERLERARFLISIAPSRPFTEKEQIILEDYMEKGGIFICMVGYEELAPIRPFLEKHQFYVGGAGLEDVTILDPQLAERVRRYSLMGEPKPLGHFKSPFFYAGAKQDYYAHVRFHSAWPVECPADPKLVVAFYPPDVPLIVVRRIGDGLMAVIGDTSFAMNKNLEWESGAPFDGKRENAHFWRWFLGLLANGEATWYPPPPEGHVPAQPEFQVEPIGPEFLPRLPVTATQPAEESP